ncbi:L-type lectin-domain containing receptor kinase IX.1-like isoform X2 [Rhodamnia argentea]|uniref:L-type lectin-domain containing receptor kinase IX.1-like isoform X2 n=1 Tax=Rhodamnia argentea TaxID=178133 RepID=A0ABM3HYX3_9MYRT|nr:L-type lectin-domain containing receptor kinase IX.1-like isoform X2 [Rhodamnia argentea]
MELHSSDLQSSKAGELRSLLVLVLSLAIAFTASASSQGIDFSLTAFNDNSIQYQGDASVSSNAIQLTKANQGQNLNESMGWATYPEPMRLWDKATGNVADFTTNFTFVINSQKESNFGDGMTFFLVPEGSQLPVNSSGRYLALVNPNRDPSNSSTSFVAIEFDTYRNNYSGVVDPNCTNVAHVGIDLNNLTSAVSSCVDWFKDKIMSGGRINATITYNSRTQNLSVLMMDADATGTDINSSAIYDIVNLTKYLPERVTLGFSAATGTDLELHTIEAWEFSSNVQVAGKKSKFWLWATLGSGSFVLLILALAFIWFRHRSKRKGTYMSGDEDDLAIDEEFEQVPGPKKFYYKDLVAATDNFAIERLLGEGGFGRVYKGYLTPMNVNVAIKKINPGSRQGVKEYASEVKTISRLRHRNLVQLIGWCHEKKELLLIYEFMSNGSLDSHLFKERTFLSWEKRYKIAQGIASALLYLHEEWEQCVVHRDIKSSNIMLDSDFSAKLGDFGLARLVDHAKGLQTTVLAGTMGYMAPECVYTGKASKESDVYSFGVVLLEIACGRKVVEPRAEEGQVRLVDWVWELYGTGRLLDAAESKLGTDFDERQLECLMVVGLWCSHPDHSARPSIREALNVLNLDAPPPVLPLTLPVPTYLAPVPSFTMASIVSSSTSGTEVSAFTTSSSQPSHSASSALLLDTN